MGGRSSVRLIASAVVIACVGGLVAWVMLRPHQERPSVFTGYVVTDNLYMAAPVSGTVTSLGVARGQRVAAGAPLFRIDPTSLGARADQARAQIGQSRAQVSADQAELARARAAMAAAQVEAVAAEVDYKRYVDAEHEKAGSVARQQMETAQTIALRAAKLLDAARTGVAAADARIEAGRALVQGSRAGLADAQQQVSQLAPTAPVAARVENVMYQPGEWAPANAPIVSLVPDNKVKVRFYVPQSVVNGFKPGTTVAIACDGCASGMTAKVDYVAPRPEYTPPVIYSLATREKLVFSVEAIPSAPRELVPGQPMDVTAIAGGKPR